MNEISINLIDCISEITNRPICMDGKNYLYLDTKDKVESNVLVEANVLKGYYLQKQMVSSIKSKAGALIEAKYPTYKQLNIIRVGGVDLETMSNYIDKVRSISNEAEKNGTKLEDISWQI